MCPIPTFWIIFSPSHESKTLSKRQAKHLDTYWCRVLIAEFMFLIDANQVDQSS